ncbi:F0F1 ATP synthase subunit B [Mycoplasma leonicaptivi]|uniref:F0F1 ATP synthase subunit B n=1 Tax=Mycoplasma leonicaptivi TaxID=36742 RepID=UPI000AB15F21|nr:F0F1 ATP synthase subunit B [Mycoplasma leonicaptivi]
MIQYFNQGSESTNTVSIETTLNEKIVGLFPSIPIIIATIIAFIIVFITLYFLVHKPVKKLIKARQDFIQNNIDDSIKQKEESILKLNQVNETLKNAHIQADNIITSAKIKAEKVSEHQIELSKKEAKRMLEETSIDIQTQQRQFQHNSKKYVVEVATDLAKKILKREITPETQKDLIDQYLNTDKEVEEL